MAIINVVKYDGGEEVFAWKYPYEELGTWTQLIVNESQEAVLFKGGQALDVFRSGRHTLETANIPLLNHIVNLPFGGRSPFTAEVWYVNRLNVLDVKWGTASPIQLQDPKYGVFLPVRAFGQFGVQVEDGKKFLVKLVGTMPMFNKSNLIQYFRGIYLMKAKDTISSYLVHKQVSVLEINAYLEEISKCLKEAMAPTLAEYGIKLINFFVNDISVPEDDRAVIKLKDALAKRAEMDIVGYNYQQERSFDTLEGAATNPSSMQGGLMGAGIGLGMGAGVGGVIGAQFGGLADNLSTASLVICPRCAAKIPAGKKFCSECGYDLSQNREQNMPILCSVCGTKLNETMKFCPQCGTPYNPCPNCKADLPEGARVCPHCGYEMPNPCPHCGFILKDKTMKFCPECGLKLVRSCPKCGIEIKGEPKFCPECGQRIGEGGEAHEKV